jgi:hypothetical protein
MIATLGPKNIEFFRTYVDSVFIAFGDHAPTKAGIAALLADFRRCRRRTLSGG